MVPTRKRRRTLAVACLTRVSRLQLRGVASLGMVPNFQCSRGLPERCRLVAHTAQIHHLQPRPDPHAVRRCAEHNTTVAFVLDTYGVSDLNEFHMCAPGAANDWARRQDARRHVEGSHQPDKIYVAFISVKFKIITLDFMSNVCHSSRH